MQTIVRECEDFVLKMLSVKKPETGMGNMLLVFYWKSVFFKPGQLLHILIYSSLTHLSDSQPRSLSLAFSFLSRTLWLFYTLCFVYLHLYSKRLKWIFISCFCYIRLQLALSPLSSSFSCQMPYASASSLMPHASCPIIRLSFCFQCAGLLLCISNTIFIRIYFHFGQHSCKYI